MLKADGCGSRLTWWRDASRDLVHLITGPLAHQPRLRQPDQTGAGRKKGADRDRIVCSPVILIYHCTPTEANICLDKRKVLVCYVCISVRMTCELSTRSCHSVNYNEEYLWVLLLILTFVQIDRECTYHISIICYFDSLQVHGIKFPRARGEVSFRRRTKLTVVSKEPTRQCRWLAVSFRSSAKALLQGIMRVIDTQVFKGAHTWVLCARSAFAIACVVSDHESSAWYQWS